MKLTIIRFPEINLRTRDAHKLRGYFGNLFKSHSELLHNHYETGELRYKYPLVQYKVLNGVPVLVALEEGAKLMTELFLQIRQLEIDSKRYEIYNKNIDNRRVEVGFSEELHEYYFDTLWMALNQDNYRKYQELGEKERRQMLSRILVGNVLSFFKSNDIFLEKSEQLLAKVLVNEKKTKFKDQDMLAFTGKFVINARLPDGIGIGKGVSRGFGTIRLIS